MNKDILRSIRRIVIYMAPEEGRHYEEDGKPRGHIFRDVMRLAKFVDLHIEDL